MRVLLSGRERAIVAAAMAIGGCGSGRPVDQRTDRETGARPAAPVRAATPFEWTAASLDVACTEAGCGEPYRLVVDFNDEAELTRAGWRRATGSKGGPAFAGGVWTAPAGPHDEWLGGPTSWGRVATRAGGWAISAKVAVRQGKAGCAPSTRGPGLRVSGDLGSITVTLLPGGLDLGGATTPIPAGAPYTLRLEGRDRSVAVSIDGKLVTSGATSDQGYSAPSAIELGQLGCSDHESRWDQLVVEANMLPCADCRAGEHPMVAAVRRVAKAPSVDTSHTAAAYSRCIAYAALDHAIRTVLVDALVAAGQSDRADQLARLDPLRDVHSVELAERVLGPMGAPPAPQGCDPVTSADDCRQPPMPQPEPVPSQVDFARRQFPNTGWTDYAASGAERMLADALAIHELAGPAAVTALLDRLTAFASPGGVCAARE